MHHTKLHDAANSSTKWNFAYNGSNNSGLFSKEGSSKQWLWSLFVLSSEEGLEVVFKEVYKYISSKDVNSDPILSCKNDNSVGDENDIALSGESTIKILRWLKWQ